MTDFRYTLLFLTRRGGAEVLMLHRRFPPNQGFWNGVGGRLEPGETPLANILREAEEETGYRIETARFAGVLTWEGHSEPAGGLYIFTAPAPPGPPAAPRDDEGELAWKPREWVLSSPEVVSNIPLFGPYVLAGGLPPCGGDEALPQDYHFVYGENDIILSWEIRPIPC